MEGCAASLIVSPDDPNTLRVVITQVNGKASFDVQLNLPNLKLDADQIYTLEFRARADLPRAVFVGVAQGHEPWAGLGLYQEIELSPEWRDFRREFTPTAADDQARIHFDLGDRAIPVELSLTAVSARQEGDRGQSRSNVLDLDLGIFGRLTPISRNWGFDRGMAIDRYYIEKFLKEHAGDIHGRVLEIEDDIYTRRFGEAAVIERDVLHVTGGNPRATIVADLTDATGIPSDSFDCALITQTLQLIYDVRAAVTTLHRILKPGGGLLVTVPGIYDVRAAVTTLHRILKPGGGLLVTVPGITRISHQEWAGSWYWLFTSASAKRLFGDIFGQSNVEVQAFGNVLTAISFLHGLAKEELHPAELDYRDRDYEVIVCVRAVKRARA
jgi:SAM-dependent methyltransferase